MILITVTPVDEIDARARRSQRLLLLVALLNASVASSIYLSILPGIVRGLDLTEFQGGLLVTSSAIAAGLLAPWWGRRSEEAGRVRIIAIGLVGYAIASAAFAFGMELGFAGTLTGGALFAVLLVSRPLGGALAGAVPGTSQAYLADTSSEEERASALALVGIASGLGAIVGPAVGGALAVFGLTVPLWTAAVVAAGVATLVWLRLPEPIRSDSGAAEEDQAPLSWRDQRPRPMLLLIVVLFTGVALLATTLGFLIQDRLGLDDQTASSVTGAVLTGVGVGLVAVQVLIVQRRNPAVSTLLRVGLPILGVGIVLLLVAPNTPLFILSGLVMGSGNGLAFSGAITGASLRVGAGDQGTLGGLTVAAQVVGFVIGPVVGGLLYQQGQLLPALTALALVVLALVAALSGRLSLPGGPAEPVTDTSG